MNDYANLKVSDSDFTMTELQDDCCMDDLEFDSLVQQGIANRKKLRFRFNRFFRRILPLWLHGWFEPWNNGKRKGIEFGSFLITMMGIGSFRYIWITWRGKGFGLCTPLQIFVDPLGG